MIDKRKILIEHLFHSLSKTMRIDEHFFEIYRIYLKQLSKSSESLSINKENNNSISLFINKNPIRIIEHGEQILFTHGNRVVKISKVSLWTHDYKKQVEELYLNMLRTEYNRNVEL